MKIIFFPAALVLASGIALAGDMPEFTDLDINGDGMLSAAEATVVEGLDFVSADADQNGILTPDEYRAAAKS